MRIQAFTIHTYFGSCIVGGFSEGSDEYKRKCVVSEDYDNRVLIHTRRWRAKKRKAV